MQQFDRYYSLIFHVDDKLTEDANMMIDGQKINRNVSERYS